MRNRSMIKFKNISKIFPGAKALDNVSFDIKKGEVHALLGENGAGKSTLLNILHGMYTEYEGDIFLDGQKVNFKNPHNAIEYGIVKVHQEISLVPELTVGQNIVLGYEPRKGQFIDFDKLYSQSDKILKRLRCKFRSNDITRDLSIGEMQMTTIAKALFHNARVISLDEPTSSLFGPEVNTLFEIIKELKNKGTTIIYVTHKLEEVFQIADRVTVLRDGKYMSTNNVSNVTKEYLIKNMVGRDVSAFAVRNRPRRFEDKVVLDVRNLSVIPYFKNVSFKLRRGEILGVFGLIGSKRTDVVRAIFGADKKNSGDIFINGIKKEIFSPEEGLKNSIGLIPEDRKAQGIVKNLTNADNIGLSCLEKFIHFGFLNHNEKKINCEHFMEKLNLTPKDPMYLTIQLSGGNQQKVVLAKWLSAKVDIIFFDEPTKGIDIGAKQEIYRLLEDLAEEGKSIIMVSSELPEIIGMSDRIIIMNKGRIVKTLNYTKFSEEQILQFAMEG